MFKAVASVAVLVAVRVCPGGATAVPYETRDAIPGVTAEPTGFFRVKRLENGRWHIFDPDGRAVYHKGVGHVRFRGVYCYRKMPPYGHYEKWNREHYPSVDAWVDETLGRLRKWGFNALGGGCGEEVLRRKAMIYSVSLSLSCGLTVGKGKEGLWICPHEGSPCTEFPNVFHPGFPAYCDKVAREKCLPNRSDPWLFGYYIDNELAWWGRGGNPTGLFDAVAKLPPEHSARKAAEDFLGRRGLVFGADVPDGAKRDFLRLAAERYFSETTAAIRRHDPNHLILGARFAGLHGADPVVWEVSGKYCDVVTFNCYPWADLDRNVVMTRGGPQGERITGAFRRRFDCAKRPFLVTEWSFPALDSGLPCTSGAGQRFCTQKERAQASELFVRTMMSQPYILGYNYFMWVDEPPEGISRYFPEDSNYGLVNEKGVPYAELTDTLRSLHAAVPELLREPPPQERAAPEESFMLADGFASAHGIVPAKGFVRTGDGWCWTNSAGMRLEGGTGKGRIVRRTVLDGRELGEFNAMGQFMSGGGSQWQATDRVTGFDFRDGALFVSAKRRWSGTEFEFLLRIVLDETRPEFLAELVRADNTGATPIEFVSFFLCQYSPFMRDKTAGRTVPNLWKGDRETAWVAEDGRVFGALTRAPGVKSFRYFTDVKHVHPDASFVPPGLPKSLAPGARFGCGGKVWMLCTGKSGI